MEIINTKCLDCGNTSRFIVPYIDRAMIVYNEHGDVVDEYTVGYQSYDDERTICGIDTCGSDNLNIYQKEN